MARRWHTICGWCKIWMFAWIMTRWCDNMAKGKSLKGNPTKSPFNFYLLCRNFDFFFCIHCCSTFLIPEWNRKQCAREEERLKKTHESNKPYRKRNNGDLKQRFHEFAIWWYTLWTKPGVDFEMYHIRMSTSVSQFFATTFTLLRYIN